MTNRISSRTSNRTTRQSRTLGAIVFLTGILSALLVSSCNYQVKKTSGDEAPVPKLSAKDIPSFSELSSSILSKRCARCHGPGDAFDVTNYCDVASRAAIIPERLKKTGSGRMPPADKPQLTQEELTLVLNWFAWGAPQEKPREGEQPPAPTPTPQPEPTPTPTPSPSPTPVPPGTKLPSFEQLKTYVLNDKCLKCHDGASDIVVDLRTYPLFSANAQTIRKCITLPIDARGHMPRGRRNQLTDNELLTLLAWLDSGCPEQGQGNWQPPAPVPPPEPTPTPQPTPTPEPTPTPVPTPMPTPPAALPSFTQLKIFVVDKKCLDCHDGSDNSTVALNTYSLFLAKLQSTRERLLLPTTDRRHMPKSRMPQLSELELKTMIDWIDAGAPEAGRGVWRSDNSTSPR